MNVWQGEKVRLRAVDPGDWSTHFEWNQDSDLGRALDAVWFPQSQLMLQQWSHNTSLRPPESDAFHFQIETVAHGILVGTINVHSCNSRVGTFSYGVAVMPAHQREGYAAEAILLVLKHYFRELRYQKVSATIFSFNEASIKLHEKLGFQMEGRLRRMGFTDGAHFDHLMYGMTAEEFAARRA